MSSGRMTFQKLRDDLPVTGNVDYFQVGSHGPTPDAVLAVVRDEMALEAHYHSVPSVKAEQAGREAAARARVASFIGAGAAEVALTPNTTQAMRLVARSIDWKDGDEVVPCNLGHGSVLSPSWHVAHRYGAKVQVLDIDPHDSWDAIVAKFEAAMNDRTRLIFVSHIEYSTGLRMPAADLCRVAHTHGAEIMLDGAQTGGHIALDVHRDGFDYYSIPGQKWVLGYEGVGALYIRRELIEQVHPAHTGGRGVTQIGEPGEPESFRINSSIMEKFLGGSGSVPLQAAFVEAAKFIESVGVPEIEARNVSLAARFKAQLAEISAVNVLSPMNDTQSAGLVSFAVAGQSADAVVARIWQDHRIVIRQVHYPESIRASLHFFNTEEEVDALARAVAELA